MSVVAYLVRHGEVEHHRADVPLTARGRAQAEATGLRLAGQVAEGDTVIIGHSPVRRVVETAELVHASLSATLALDGRANRVRVAPLQLDLALSNVRFICQPGCEPEEPSLLYEPLNAPGFLQKIPPARADYYRGFWASADPMGYWLTQDSHGGAEAPEDVLARLLTRVQAILAGEAGLGRTHWIMVTHSGALRVVLRHALGADPGEPFFCEVVTITPPLERAALLYRGQTVALKFA